MATWFSTFLLNAFDHGHQPAHGQDRRDEVRGEVVNVASSRVGKAPDAQPCLHRPQDFQRRGPAGRAQDAPVARHADPRREPIRGDRVE
jgi:hypothetical protein